MLFLSVPEVHDTGALESMSTTDRNRRIFPCSKMALTCAFCPASHPGMTGRSYARVVTRKLDDGAGHSSGRRKWAVELGLLFRSAGQSVMPAARMIVTDLSQV